MIHWILAPSPHLFSILSRSSPGTYLVFLFLPFSLCNLRLPPPLCPFPLCHPPSLPLSPSLFFPPRRVMHATSSVWATAIGVCACVCALACVSGERERDIDRAPNTEHASASGSRQTWATQPSTAGPAAAAAHTHTLTHTHTLLHTRSKRQPGGQHWQRQLPGRGQRRSLSCRWSGFPSRCRAEPQCKSTHGGADRQHRGDPHWNPRPTTDGKSSFFSHCWREDKREGSCLSPFLAYWMLSFPSALSILLYFFQTFSSLSLSHSLFSLSLPSCLYNIPRFTLYFFLSAYLVAVFTCCLLGVPLPTAYSTDVSLINLPLH